MKTGKNSKFAILNSLFDIQKGVYMGYHISIKNNEMAVNSMKRIMHFNRILDTSTVPLIIDELTEWFDNPTKWKKDFFQNKATFILLTKTGTF